MKRSAYALVLALFLTALSLSIFVHKVTALNIPVLPAQSYDTWSIEAKIILNEADSLIDQVTTEQTSSSAQLNFYLPQDSQRYTVVDESLDGVGDQDSDTLKNQVTTDASNRTVTLESPLLLDNRTLFYRATVRSDASPSERENLDPTTLGQQIVKKQIEQIDRTTSDIKEALRENPPTASIESLINEARNSSNNDYSFARQIYQLVIQSDDNRVQSLKETLKSDNSSTELAAFLLNEVGIAARVGNGILLNPEEAAATQFSQWLEINRDQRWFAYDPVRDQFGAQTRYLTWWYGPGAVLTSPEITDAAIEITARPDTTDGLSRSVWHNDEASFFLKYSLIGLPLATQRVMQVLVMIPIGALIVAALHQMVGFSTFGTFTPVLIALSFRETGLIQGILFFSLIVFIGALVRSALNRAQLLVVPRLSAVLTVTVLMIVLLTVFSDTFGLEYGLSISLFPIVILAMTIERAAVMWEEEGIKETAIAALGSLAVAVIGFLVIDNPYVQHWAFVFPELLLIVLALTMLLGRYNGYKLTEYIRFIALQKQIQQAQ